MDFSRRKHFAGVEVFEGMRAPKTEPENGTQDRLRDFAHSTPKAAQEEL
jgi:hypothetical protein